MNILLSLEELDEATKPWTEELDVNNSKAMDSLIQEWNLWCAGNPVSDSDGVSEFYEFNAYGPNKNQAADVAVYALLPALYDATYHTAPDDMQWGPLTRVGKRLMLGLD